MEQWPGEPDRLWGEDEEVEFPPIVSEIIESSRDLADRIVDRIMQLYERYPSLIEALNKLEWGPLRRSIALRPGFAIDSTFPIEGGVDLVGGHLAVIVAGYVGFAGARAAEGPAHGAIAKALFMDDEEARSRIPLYAKMLEKKVAIRLLRSRPQGAEFKVLLFDGELVPYKVLFRPERLVKRSPTLSKLAELTARVLEEAKSAGVIAVGVVKRSYSRLFRVVCGDLPLNDKAIASIIMKKGQYLVLGRFADLIPRYAEVIEEERRRKGKPAKGYAEGVRRLLSDYPVFGDIVVGFYKPWGSSQAIRVELLSPSLGFDEVASMLAKLTNPATGLPYPVDMVDSFVRLESYVLELVRRRIIHHLAGRLPMPGSLVVLSHTNPEKRYLYEPRRRRP